MLLIIYLPNIFILYIIILLLKIHFKIKKSKYFGLYMKISFQYKPNFYDSQISQVEPLKKSYRSDLRI